LNGEPLSQIESPQWKKTYDNGEDSGSYILTQNHTLYILERERERERKEKKVERNFVNRENSFRETIVLTGKLWPKL